jgi:hypothetical protein
MSPSASDLFGLVNIIPFAGVVLLALTALVHILFAVAVARDASQLHVNPPYSGTTLVGLAGWTLATLLGGVFVAALYWLLNRSTLRPVNPPNAGERVG